MGSSFGHLFRVTTFGESHGTAIGCVIDGCPPGFDIALEEIQDELNRRRPGQSTLTTARSEGDKVEILSGIFEGKSLGSPIALLIRNKDADESAYRPFKELYRPSHADYTTEAKYGHRDWRGGGRASARETAMRVAAGAIAKQLLRSIDIEIVAWVSQVGKHLDPCRPDEANFKTINSSLVRCASASSIEPFSKAINDAREKQDTIGGVITFACRSVPAGLGEPVFDKLEADLAKAMMSIPASKGFEIGLGFTAAGLRGSQHNDPFVASGSEIQTSSNNSGGIQGGISNGMTIYGRVAFKPVATILQQQTTVDRQGNPAVISPKGRHDPCVLPRAVPIVEAMAALTIVDHWLRQRAISMS